MKPRRAPSLEIALTIIRLENPHKHDTVDARPLHAGVPKSSERDALHQPGHAGGERNHSQNKNEDVDRPRNCAACVLDHAENEDARRDFCKRRTESDGDLDWNDDLGDLNQALGVSKDDVLDVLAEAVSPHGGCDSSCNEVAYLKAGDLSTQANSTRRAS